MSISVGYSQEKWRDGIKLPYIWDLQKVPHLLLSGITGGGKTSLAQTIMNQILNTNMEITICDFKAGGDWDGIVEDYAEYIDCDEALDHFYTSFCETIAEKGHREKLLLFDEFSSYALSKDNTKDFKDMMSKVSHMAFMGRSFGYHLLFISQQFNSKVLDTAIREQFGIKIYMGSTISTESATMLFPKTDIDKSKHLPPYCGYITMPEREIEIIQAPYIEEPNKLKKLLQQKGQSRHK